MLPAGWQPGDIVENAACLQPDQSVATMDCVFDGDAGRCATVHIKTQGGADNIL